MPHSMDIIFRAAELNDSESLYPLVCDLSSQDFSIDLFKDRFESILTSPIDQILVPTSQGSPVGFIHLNKIESLTSGSFAEVRSLYVNTSFRNKGIGRSLLERAGLQASEMGIETLRVRTNILRKGNSDFFEKAGFTLFKQQHVFEKKC